VVLTYAVMPGAIDGWYGAPQSVASDQFQWQGDFTQSPGFKLEVPPINPVLTAALFGRIGEELTQALGQMNHINAMLALVRDGFHPESPGGQVRIDESGYPVLDYDISDYLFAGFQQALLRMAEAQFAAGARRVIPAHLDGRWATSWAEAKAQIETLPYRKLRLALATAHLMGGCGMGEDERKAVTNSEGRHHQIENLTVNDGSLFPTSIGANPQLSIYALAARNATLLARQLKPAATIVPEGE
jgi:choline dehydrogenase